MAKIAVLGYGTVGSGVYEVLRTNREVIAQRAGEELEEVRKAMAERRTAKIGIGLGNIYKRIHMIYQGGDLHIYSREGRGTIIQMILPQKDAGMKYRGEDQNVQTAGSR